MACSSRANCLSACCSLNCSHQCSMFEETIFCLLETPQLQPSPVWGAATARRKLKEPAVTLAEHYGRMGQVRTT